MLTLPDGSIVEEITVYVPGGVAPPLVIAGDHILAMHYGPDTPTTLLQFKRPDGEVGVLVNMPMHIRARRSSLVIPGQAPPGA